MLLNDSIELNYIDYSASADPVPMSWDIDLSKIWIPSSLLPNRKKPINRNESKPFILHTLEKPDYSNTFSVYADECRTSAKISCSMLSNEDIPEATKSCQNTIEWETSSVNSNQLYDSLDRNAAESEKKTATLQEARWKASLEDLTRRMAEILSEEEPSKENWHHEDIIETNQVATGSTIHSILPNTKDSLEELYFSDEDEDQLYEYNLENLKLESPKKKHALNICIENSDVQELQSESFVNNSNGLELVTNTSDQTVHQFFEETGEIPCESQKIVVNNQSEQNEIGFVVPSEQKILNHVEKSEDTTAENVEVFSIAYKRPPLQEHSTKTKSQKEKKKTKKAKVIIPLEDLFQSENRTDFEEVTRFQIPEVDEFYENLVHQGKCKPHHEKTDVYEFPTVNVSDESQNSFWDSAQMYRQSLGIEPQSNSLGKIKRKKKKVEPQHESNASSDMLIIDNIPLNLSKENIENFIVGFGELKNLTIVRRGKLQRAKLQYPWKE